MSHESPVRVLPPWLEHPFRITSWYDMNKFSADEFVKIGAGLEWFGDLFEKGKWDNIAKDLGESMCNRLEGDLQAIGCGISAKAAHRLGFDLAIMKSFADLKPRFSELKDVILDEMGQQLFLWVPSERARYYEYPEDTSKWNETEKA